MLVFAVANGALLLLSKKTRKGDDDNKQKPYNITVYSMTSNVITDLINTSKAAWRAAGSPYSGMSI